MKRWMSWFKAVGVVAVVCLVVAPAFAAASLAARIKELSPGTTKAQVIEKLGPPISETPITDGKQTLIYEDKPVNVPPQTVGNAMGDQCLLTLQDDKLKNSSCLSDVFGR